MSTLSNVPLEIIANRTPQSSTEGPLGLISSLLMVEGGYSPFTDVDVTAVEIWLLKERSSWRSTEKQDVNGPGNLIPTSRCSSFFAKNGAYLNCHYFECKYIRLFTRCDLFEQDFQHGSSYSMTIVGLDA